MANDSLEGMSESELASIVALNRALATNEKTRKSYLGLVKEVDPSVVLPELEASRELDIRIAEERRARESLEEKIRERDVTDRIEKARNKIKGKYNLSDDDITGVEKLMTERKIGDYDTAAEFYDMSRKAAAPTSAQIRSSVFNKPNEDWFKGDPSKIARNLADEALRDLQKNRLANQ